MRLNTTGIAARMMLSLDKKAIGEKLINGRQINPTPLQVRYPPRGKRSSGDNERTISHIHR